MQMTTTIETQIKFFDRFLAVFALGSVSFFIGIFAHRIGLHSISEPLLALSMLIFMPTVAGAIWMIIYGTLFKGNQDEND